MTRLHLPALCHHPGYPSWVHRPTVTRLENNGKYLGERQMKRQHLLAKSSTHCHGRIDFWGVKSANVALSHQNRWDVMVIPRKNAINAIDLYSCYIAIDPPYVLLVKV